MKSTIKYKEREFEYPCLMISTGNGVVVLFISAAGGFVVYDPKGKFNLGTYREDWKGHGIWEHFKGQVILEN